MKTTKGSTLLILFILSMVFISMGTIGGWKVKGRQFREYTKATNKIIDSLENRIIILESK